MTYFNGTELRSMMLAAGLLLLGAAARLGLGPGPDDFTWTLADRADGRAAPSLDGTRRRVAHGVAEEEISSLPLGVNEKLDPNRASVAQLRRLPGIGPARADAIVAERVSGGSFRGPADLARVPGIGLRTVEALGPHLSFGSSSPAANFGPDLPPSSESAFPVDVNRAQIKELEQITGIGPTLAARIVASRQRLGRFEDPEDLLRVPGIGPVVLQRIRDQVRF